MLNAKMHATLSHSVSSFGSHPRRLPRVRASASRRLLASAMVKVLPVRPQVKGFLLLAGGWRPCLGFVMNSAMVISLGGSAACQSVIIVYSNGTFGKVPKGNFGTHAGGSKTMLAACT